MVYQLSVMKRHPTALVATLARLAALIASLAPFACAGAGSGPTPSMS
ncbi:MAG: hypothetical protein QOI41_1414, partial [Myxococcales bacterium]|nr:hypothetical protein [Myxococcales bacterium]